MKIISKLLLSNFRNIILKKFEFPKSLTIFVGKNGVGKTNILEGLTLLGRSSSLRGSEMEEMVNLENKDKEFAILADLENHEFIEKISISFDVNSKKKSMKINGDAVNSKRQSDLKNYLINFVCLTPRIEQLFILGKSERRNYLDKIVSDIDPKHNSRVSDYQKSLNYSNKYKYL